VQPWAIKVGVNVHFLNKLYYDVNKTKKASTASPLLEEVVLFLKLTV
jgi:hypothetical protein